MLIDLVLVFVVVDISLAFVYVTAGWIEDRRERRRAVKVDEIRFAAAAVLLGPVQESSDDFDRLHRQPRRLLIEALQSLAFDLTGPSKGRLVQMADALRIDAVVRNLASESRWRRRARAGQLLHLLPADDPTRRHLLHDRNPMVRAYAAESLGHGDIEAEYNTLLGMLDDESRAVRVAAQNALLRSDGRSVGQLVAYLNGPERPGLIGAVEVASRVPDPRLVAALTLHTGSHDVRIRRAVAEGLGQGSRIGSTPHLLGLLDDAETEVRVAAADSIGQLRAVEAAPRVAELLSDRAWQVRRSAALALDEIGPVGALLLRQALAHHDPFARDIARQVLDAAAVRSRLMRPPSLDAVHPTAGMNDRERGSMAGSAVATGGGDGPPEAPGAVA